MHRKQPPVNVHPSTLIVLFSRQGIFLSEDLAGPVVSLVLVGGIGLLVGYLFEARAKLVAVMSGGDTTSRQFERSSAASLQESVWGWEKGKPGSSLV